MKYLSICPDEYNYEQALGIIHFLNGDKNSTVLKIPNIKNIFFTYFILFIYFLFFRWTKFIKNTNHYDCVIVTGKSVVCQGIIIADQLDIPLRSVQKPFGYPWFLFQYQYIPYHDISWFFPKNQIPILLAPNTLKHNFNNNRNKKISILIGGSLYEKKYKINKILEAIKFYKKMIDHNLEIITSRRTSNELIEEINKLGLNVNTKYGSTKDAYYNSEIVVITDDSYCMISEAIQSGIKPIIIYTGNIGRRLKKGIKLLFETKKIYLYNNESL